VVITDCRRRSCRKLWGLILNVAQIYPMLSPSYGAVTFWGMSVLPAFLILGHFFTLGFTSDPKRIGDFKLVIDWPDWNGSTGNVITWTGCSTGFATA
jgi:hypothetical protein